ncbi:triose-phosphate isomerase [Candidatus Coxiella mudrowiae]|uniref:Triosephosphate isomerase n=1 Tax=Candidatus Coxiella mudrowiae TaxID=2054173 RepID=A0ABN4HNW9_9COXI|nr:triose-phosphate isomerase [Candidatus Coxiella mudrowiae]AKQ33322.1 Triosephosphate isomerase [Candidatus Coxiella mudrowiae]
MGRRPLVAGNWKMHGTLQSIAGLLEGLKHGCERIETAELLVIPPYIFIPQCKEALLRTQISWGAQDVSEYEVGPYTGEISATMLRDFLCHYVIIGHSERRKLHGETNESVARKVKRALENGIRPIICVGETEAQREAGKTLEIVQEQLAVVLRMHDNRASLSDIVIAYEPVWAIGTGKNASPVQSEEVHAAIREQLRHYDATIAENTRILYGGSVKPENARALFTMANIDGALVGGASLKAEHFLKIGEQCNQLY